MSVYLDELRTYACDILELEVQAPHPYAAARVAVEPAAKEPHKGEWFAGAVHWVAEAEDGGEES